MNLLIQIPEWAYDLFPETPFGYIREPNEFAGYYCYSNLSRKLFVICSASIEKDNKRWIHVSCSKPSSLPTWSDLLHVKQTFIGNRKAIQIFPKEEEYVNICKNALHLWSCLDGDPIPDFRKGGMI